MKNTITFLLVILLSQLSYAQVAYKNFGTGLVIPINANYQIDINADGIADLNVNSLNGQLGFDPIPDQGCVGTPSTSETNSFGSLSLKTFDEGELIRWTANNFQWSEDDETSAYSNTQGFDAGWDHAEFKLIGFMLLQGNTTACGWMRVAIDEDEQTLILREWAYQEEFFTSSLSGIYAGTETEFEGLVSVNDLNSDKIEFSIFPNPTRNAARISYELPTSSELDIEVLDQLGRVVYTEHVFNRENAGIINLDVSHYSAGNYFLKLSSADGLQVKQLQIK